MSAQIQERISADTPEHLFQLGLAVSTGMGGRMDLIEAHKWFNIAAARGDKVAAQHREEVASEMTREEIAAALRAAREWMQRH